jgi:hypothetical protein
VGLCAIGAWLLATTVSAVQESPAQVPPAQPPGSRTPDIQPPNTRSPAALTIDACALLVPGEIATVIGLPVKPGVRRDAGLVSNGSYSSACVWEVDAGTSGPADPQAPLGGKSFVILNAMQWPTGSGLAHTFLDSFRQAAADGTIPGKPSARDFGDAALWWGDGLAVCKGDVSFGISVFLPTSAARPPKGVFEEQLAPRILRRLEHAPQ